MLATTGSSPVGDSIMLRTTFCVASLAVAGCLVSAPRAASAQELPGGYRVSDSPTAVTSVAYRPWRSNYRPYGRGYYYRAYGLPYGAYYQPYGVYRPYYGTYSYGYRYAPRYEWETPYNAYRPYGYGGYYARPRVYTFGWY
jgi:hypothetical protein